MTAIDTAAPIADLGLSTRTCNTLVRADIRTVGKLADCHAWDLLDLRQFGEGAYREVVAALAKHDLELKPTPSDWPAPPKVE